MMRRALVAAVALALLSGCAGISRALSYGNGWADAIYTTQGKRYEVWMHPKDNTILLNGSIGDAMAKGVIGGLTLGIAGRDADASVWMTGARAFLDPAGCRVKDLYPVQLPDSWEVVYECPNGVDLRQLVREQRAALRDGKPLDLAR